jgi:hypothetical protein
VFAILGEDYSDVDTLKVILRRLRGDPHLPIRGKGYSGSGELLQKGCNQLLAFAELGCRHFVVCHDADGADPAPHHAQVAARIVKPAGVADRCCIVIPVQELEAWLLADIEAVSNLFDWQPHPIANPENVPSPKEHLEKLSRISKHRSRYNHAKDNPRLAEHIDLAKVSKKCRSFHPLEKFVQSR